MGLARGREVLGYQERAFSVDLASAELSYTEIITNYCNKVMEYVTCELHAA